MHRLSPHKFFWLKIREEEKTGAEVMIFSNTSLLFRPDPEACFIALLRVDGFPKIMVGGHPLAGIFDNARHQSSADAANPGHPGQALGDESLHFITVFENRLQA